jgi:hypothetical protein
MTDYENFYEENKKFMIFCCNVNNVIATYFKKNVNNEKLDFMILLENCLVEALKGKKKKKKKKPRLEEKMFRLGWHYTLYIVGLGS